MHPRLSYFTFLKLSNPKNSRQELHTPVMWKLKNDSFLSPLAKERTLVFNQRRLLIGRRRSLKHMLLFGALGIFAIVFLFCFDTVHVWMCDCVLYVCNCGGGGAVSVWKQRHFLGCVPASCFFTSVTVGAVCDKHFSVCVRARVCACTCVRVHVCTLSYTDLTASIVTHNSSITQLFSASLCWWAEIKSVIYRLCPQSGSFVSNIQNFSASVKVCHHPPKTWLLFSFQSY